MFESVARRITSMTRAGAVRPAAHRAWESAAVVVARRGKRLHSLLLRVMARERAQLPARRNLRNDKVSLTTTLITKLLTNPLARSPSTADAGDQSPASGPVHHTGRLSMAWKRSGVRVP